jgi:hypothetical protein
MVAGFRLVMLRKLTWFKFCESHLDWLNIAVSNDVVRGPAASDLPAAWVSPPRKQLDASELQQRCTFTLVVPKAMLEATLNGGALQAVSSQTIYMAGTGVELYLTPSMREDGVISYGLYLRTSSYTQHGTTVCRAGTALSCEFELLRQVPGEPQMRRVIRTEATLATCGWGTASAITASTPAELEPHLVDGHLRLKAKISMIPA